ncbi:MAG: VOC family protein [Verrucomicrobiota bacterium]|nr:VOC family protein [Verrucomicrobiota bacterium]
MIKEIAFVGSPVTDITRARGFYEGVLGLKPSSELKPDAKWIEYEVGNGTFGIGDYGDQWRPAPSGGTMAAFESDELDALVQRVKESGAPVVMDIMDTPVCRFAMVLDPDGNCLMLHKRKED